MSGSEGKREGEKKVGQEEETETESKVDARETALEEIPFPFS